MLNFSEYQKLDGQVTDEEVYIKLEQKEILDKLRKDKGNISNQEAKELINKSADEANKIINHAERMRKETISKAQQTYKGKVAQYQKMHKDIPGYTKDMCVKIPRQFLTVADQFGNCTSTRAAPRFSGVFFVQKIKGLHFDRVLYS